MQLYSSAISLQYSPDTLKWASLLRDQRKPALLTHTHTLLRQSSCLHTLPNVSQKALSAQLFGLVSFPYNAKYRSICLDVVTCGQIFRASRAKNIPHSRRTL